MKTAKKWEKLTKLELERADYDLMVINDVNNYLARTLSGKIKYKGSYEIDPDLHKNSSQRIVPIALKRYFVDNIPIAETIYDHISKTGQDYEGGIKNYGIFDFCQGRKVQWNQEYVIIKGVNEDEVDQKVIRYYNTTERTTMMKKYDDGRVEAVNKGYRAKVFQEYEEKEEQEYKIDYHYYLNECYKITTLFDGGNPKSGKQLKLFNE